MAHTSASPEMEDELALELRECVQRVVQKAVSKLDGGAAQQAVYGTVHAVHLSVEVAIANALRERNNAVSPAARLPEEILVSAWTYSNVEVRVAVSGVCQRWRSVALGSPAMWTHVDAFSSEHDDECVCHICGEWRSGGTHNLPAVALALQRSKDRPFALTIVNAFEDYSETFVDALVTLIAAHAHRLESLHLDLEHPAFLIQFTNGFERLPALRSLTVAAHISFSRHPGRMILNPIDLPVVHRIILPHTRHIFYRDWSTSLHSLRILECSIFSSTALRWALTACQHLAQLRLHLDGWENAPSDFAIDANLQAMLDRIPDIRISNVAGAAAMWAQRHFGINGRSKLQLDLAGELSALDLTLLQSVVQPVHMDVAVAGEQFSVTCRDNAQRQICLTCPLVASDDCLRVVWRNLPADAVTALQVDAVAWLRVVGHVTAVADLIVRLDSPASFFPLLSPPGVMRFPRLTTLVLRNTQRTLALSLASVMVFIESLGLQGPLETLQLDGVVIQTPGDAPVRRVTQDANPDRPSSPPLFLCLVECGLRMH